MSIPKVIHYCWFGKGKMPKLANKCIKSWKKYCPDYKIICHNEDNFDLTQNRYLNEAYKGGIYLDTDVELIKPIDDLLLTNGFMGFDEKGIVATGLGFGAEKGNEIVSEFLKDYDNIPFVLPDGSYNLTPCPDRNTEALKRLGMDLENKNQTFMDITFLPDEYLCPMDYYTGKKTITENTYSIHHYSASWTASITKRTTRIKRIIGVKMYNKLYGKFLQNCKWLEW